MFNNKHHTTFHVTCYRYDAGIFTVYGARIKQRKVSTPCPSVALNNRPSNTRPHFIDTIRYEVVLFTNPELDQSMVAYANNNLYKAQNYLDNFIDLYRHGCQCIDLAKIADEKHPHPHPHPIPPCPPPHPWGPFYKNDKMNEKMHDDMIDPRYIHDPRTNPYYDVFENITKEPCYAKGPKPNPYPPFDEYDIDLDFNKAPKHDGDIVKIGNPMDNCNPHMPSANFMPEPPVEYGYHPEDKCSHNYPWPVPPCPPCPPGPHPHPHPIPPCPPGPHPHPHPIPPCPPGPHPCPPEPPVPPFIPPCPPPYRDKICIYYGNGGFMMGESVVGENVKLMARNALRTMICKNYHSTFSNMNPRDTIVVKKQVLDCILPSAMFKSQMDIAGEWSFFMIPDVFHRLVSEFTWYYKEETIDGKWFEVSEDLVQREFVLQDNGVRYFICAVKLNGRYDMRFARKGRDLNTEAEEVVTPDIDHREFEFDMKFMISLYIQACKEKEYKVTIQDLNENYEMVRTLPPFINDEYAWIAVENHVYKLDIYAKTGEELATKFFVACPDDNYTHGFCTWIGDNYDDSAPIVDQFTKVIDLEPPKTKSAVDRIVLKTADIEG